MLSILTSQFVGLIIYNMISNMVFQNQIRKNIIWLQEACSPGHIKAI